MMEGLQARFTQKNIPIRLPKFYIPCVYLTSVISFPYTSPFLYIDSLNPYHSVIEGLKNYLRIKHRILKTN